MRRVRPSIPLMVWGTGGCCVAGVGKSSEWAIAVRPSGLAAVFAGTLLRAVAVATRLLQTDRLSTPAA